MQCSFQDRTRTEFEYKGEKVKLVRYGIGNRYKDRIEIHEKIYREYPEVFEQIMNHELDHTKGNLSWKDILIDSYTGNIPAKEFRKFLFSTPSAWIQFIPIWIKFKPFDVIINPMQLIVWSIIIGFISILILI